LPLTKMRQLLFALGLFVLLSDVHLYTVIDSSGTTTEVDPAQVTPFPDFPPPPLEELDQIVNGTLASIKSFPYMAALFLAGSLCGGTLYNSSYIITAAHCLYGKSQASVVNFTVLLNSSSLNGSPGYIALRPRKFVIHPSYSPTTMNYDVALLALSTKVNLPSTMLPAVGSTATYEGSSALIAGWGTTSSAGSISYDLRQATVTVWNNTLCGTRYGTGTSGINSLKLCAAAPGKDTCQGDSGGPIIVGGVQVGITSYGNGCALAYYPGVYARLTALASWVRATVPTM